MHQISSPVYQYDFLLSKHEEVMDEITMIYHQNEEEHIREEARPEPGIYLDRLYAKCTSTGAWTENVLSRTVKRWKQYQDLRKLYQDLADEYEDFRTRFAGPMPERERKSLIAPGLNTSKSLPGDLATSRSDRSPFVPRAKIKRRFHQSLCLLSLAILARRVGYFSFEESKWSPKIPTEKIDGYIEDIGRIWVKDSVLDPSSIYPDDYIRPNMTERYDCIEVFDFIYIFLLRKIIPHHKRDDWIADGAVLWPFNHCNFSDLDDKSSSAWYALLKAASLALQPADILDLFQHEAQQATSSYPPDKHEYLKVRGLYDLGADDRPDWFARFERSSMLSWVDGGIHTDIATNGGYHAELPCWWDKVRAITGSPFRPEFMTRYVTEQPKIKGYHSEFERMYRPSWLPDLFCTGPSVANGDDATPVSHQSSPSADDELS